MLQRTPGGQPAPDTEVPGAPPPQEVRFGLSARLLVLTVLFGMMAVVLVYVPLMSNYRQNWLNARIAGAYTAALVVEAAPNGMVSDALGNQILNSIGARMVAVETNGSRRILGPADVPAQADVATDLREMSPLTDMRQALGALSAGLRGHVRLMRVIGSAPMAGDSIELVMSETRLQDAMFRFSRTLLFVSLTISIVTAGLIYIVLNLVIVRPVRRLTKTIAAFGRNPEDVALVLQTSARSDEIGMAERELAAMQRQLAGALQQKSRLAALGLAVSKINHDLRNLLTAAQLFSDRLAASQDPMVQRFVPKLVETLDRAIAFCQSTLSYGRAAERLPARRLVPVAPLVCDVRDLLGLGPDAAVTWVQEIPADLHVDADPEQISRVLLNLARNALEALGGRGTPDPAQDRISVHGGRDGAMVRIDVADTGPGVPERARQRLFEAFSGSGRPGGTGLGLAIAAELVRAHGGTLTLVEGGPGAVFRLEIPDRGAGA